VEPCDGPQRWLRITLRRIWPANGSAVADLLRAFGLEQVGDSTPVIGIVSRFAMQRDLTWWSKIAGRLSELDVAVVALGSGEPV